MGTRDDNDPDRPRLEEPEPESRVELPNYVSSLPPDAVRRILAHITSKADIRRTPTINPPPPPHTIPRYPVSEHYLFSPSSPFAPILREHIREIILLEEYEPGMWIVDDRMLINIVYFKWKRGEFEFDHCLGAAQCLRLPNAVGARSKNVENLLHRIGDQIVRLRFYQHPEKHFRQEALRNAHVSWVQLCPNLKELVYSCKSLEFMLPLWLKIGANLVSLELTSVDSTYWRPNLDSIREHCRSLTSISLRHSSERPGEPVVSSREFSDFIASFGDKLKYAELPSLDKEACVIIKSACPNLRVTLTSRNYEGIAALGPIVQRLVVDLFSSNWTQLKDAMSSCRSLSSLKVFHTNVLPIGCCHALLCSPFMNLQNLSLPLIPCHRLDQKPCLLNLVCKQTGSLRRLMFACYIFENHVLFSRLVSLNPRLEVVGIYESKYDPEHSNIEAVLSRLTMFLNVFMRCKYLRSLNARFLSVLPPKACVSDALVPYRHRTVSVKIVFSDIESGRKSELYY